MADPGNLDGLTEDDLLDDAEVDTLVRETINQTIGDSQFSHGKLNAWTNNIIEGCLKKLAALGKPFKYVVTCNLVQKAGAGLHVAASSRWRGNTDGKMPVQWENKTLFVLATVFWLAI